MAKQPIKRLFDWDLYGRKVMNGDLNVSKWTRAMVERHYDDMKHGHERGLWFSEAHAQFALQSFLFFKHSKGEFAGRQFVPSEWQAFHIALAFGWMRADGTRRFREVIEFTARKNGKTTKLSGLGLYMMLFDGERGAEIYSAATKRDQAKIMLNEATQMVRTSPHLRRYIKERKNELFIPGGMEKFEPLGSDSNKQDGLNVHCALLDEIHAHRTSGMYDILKTAMGGRRQPMIWSISTAGYDLSGFGYQKYLYALKVLDGSIKDDETLAIIYTVDDPDAWDDPREWFKANPNMGVSVYEDNFRRDCELAQRDLSFQPAFKTKNLNIWLASGTTWIPMEQWRGCADVSLRMSDFSRCECWIGLDLAEKADIAALSIVFREGDRFYAFFRLYLNDYEVSKQENDHLRRYRDCGELIVNDGNVTDFHSIRRDIEDICQQYAVNEIAYDPYFSQYFAVELADAGLPMVEFPQTARNMGPAITELENLILEQRLFHNGMHIMEWMMSNVVIRESKFTGLKHATKERRENKIDGCVALMMALSRAMARDSVDIDAALSRSRII